MIAKQWKWGILFLAVSAGTYLGLHIAASAYLSPVPAEERQARLKTQQTTWDFGLVPKHSADLEASFRVRNVGDKRLLLIEQSTGCSCLSSAKPEVVIAPGEETKLRVLLDSRQFDGRVSKQILYDTNDSDQPTLTFTLVANITHAEGSQP